MRVKQLSIFLENKPGRVAEATGILNDANINIRALSVADTTDYGILRLIVDDFEKAYSVLKKNKYSTSLTDVIAVEIEDTPGGLHKALVVFGKENINVEYMYAFVSWKKNDTALIIFRVENIEKAVEVLQNSNFKVISMEELFS